MSSYPKAKRACRYADVRVEVSEGKVAVAENGMDKFSGEDYGFAFGVRVIAGRPRLGAGLRRRDGRLFGRSAADAAAARGAGQRLRAGDRERAVEGGCAEPVQRPGICARGRRAGADRRAAGHDRRSVRDGPAGGAARRRGEVRAGRVRAREGDRFRRRVQLHLGVHAARAPAVREQRGRKHRPDDGGHPGDVLRDRAGAGRAPGAVRLHGPPARLGADHARHRGGVLSTSIT